MSMTKIEHIDVGSGGQASIEFDLIPDTYTDLYLLCSMRAGSGGGGGLDIYLTFNSDGSNYSSRDLFGTGSGNGASAAGGTSNIRLGQMVNAATADTFGSFGIYIPNYTGSNAKSVSAEMVSENNATLGFQFLIAGLWNDSAAIDTITLDPESTFNFAEFSSATLFGITAASDGTTVVS